MKYQLTVEGKPVAASRPRFNSYTKAAYDAPKARDYKAKIATEAIESKQAMLPAETPLIASVKIYVPMTESWAKKKKTELLGKPVISKPDIDNYLKLIFDALNTIAYPDDSAIVGFDNCLKVYSEKPRIEVLIRTLDDNQ